MQDGTLFVACCAPQSTSNADTVELVATTTRSDMADSEGAHEAGMGPTHTSLVTSFLSPGVAEQLHASAHARGATQQPPTSYQTTAQSGNNSSTRPPGAPAGGAYAASSIASDNGWGPRSHKGPAAGVLFAAHEDPSGALARVMAAAQSVSTKALSRRVKAAVADVDRALQIGGDVGG